ncbi:MAG: HAMP domain-containing protein [Alphaproteobacteria bacterium]|nr:HAMP domain-containing protein [Alphaproteobacteria bacterium]
MTVQPARAAQETLRANIGSTNTAMVARLQRMSLTVRLFLLVTIAILPALGIQAYNEFDLRRSREADIRDRVVQITKQFGEEMGELREGARQLLIAVAQLPQVTTKSAESCSTLLASLKSVYANYSLLGAADAQGQVFCTSGKTSLMSVAGQAFFQRAMAKDGLAVGLYWADPATGEKSIHFAHRFYDAAGNVAGIVFAGLDLAWLSEHLKERGLTPSQSILIADREGNIIARLPHPEQLVGKNMRKSHEGIMDGYKTGWEEAAGVDGLTRIFGYLPAQLPPYDFFLSAGQEKSEALEPIVNATRLGVGLILVGFVLALYAAWWGGRLFIRRPVDNLLQVANQWRDGNESARVNLRDTASEVGRLGLAFNDMADALAARHGAQKKAEEELRQLNATLEERVVQRTEELARANRLATLGKLTATVSHELRNPLAVIRNTVFALGEAAKANGLNFDRSLKRIERNVIRCNEIITELLDYTRTRKLDAAPRLFDEWLVDILNDYEVPPGIALRRQLDAAGAEVTFDSGRLQRVFVNLLDNARDAISDGRSMPAPGTARESSITVRTKVVAGRFQVVVSDTGAGIPPEVFPKIFEPLFSTKGFGIGLGLPTVKQIIEQHGGDIQIESSVGQGTTVTLWLPLFRVQDMAA